MLKRVEEKLNVVIKQCLYVFSTNVSEFFDVSFSHHNFFYFMELRSFRKSKLPTIKLTCIGQLLKVTASHFDLGNN